MLQKGQLTATIFESVLIASSDLFILMSWLPFSGSLNICAPPAPQHNDFDLQLFISRALSPAKVNSLKIDEETKRVEVILNPEEVSKAIGKGGSNIRLAGKLTGYEIDVFREGIEEDIELKEFSDEIEEWVIEEFKKVGLDTAKSILELEKADLIKRTDLEEETINEVLRILNEEFEE